MSGLEASDATETSAFCIKEGYGVVPRSIERLFELVESEMLANTSTSFNLYCSFLEVMLPLSSTVETTLTIRSCVVDDRQIYNEKIYDLLAPSTALSPAHQASRKRKENSGPLTHRAGWNTAALASKDAPSLPIRQKLDGSVFVDGLTSRNILNHAEMLQAFREVRREFLSVIAKCSLTGTHDGRAR